MSSWRSKIRHPFVGHIKYISSSLQGIDQSLTTCTINDKLVLPDSAWDKIIPNQYTVHQLSSKTQSWYIQYIERAYHYIVEMVRNI